MRWTGERLTWDDILEMVEDREFEGNESRADEGWTTVGMGKMQYGSYKEALMAANVNYGSSSTHGQVNGNQMCMNVNSMSPEYLRGAGNGYRARGVRMQQPQERPNMSGRNGMSRNGPKCYRCGREGHVISACRWSSGACFKCGSREHMIRDCPNAGVNCFKCGEAGHMAAGCVNRSMVPACGNCGERGHFMRTCSKERIVCGNCGVSGHRTQICKARVNSEPRGGASTSTQVDHSQGN